jgi:endonuclease III
MATAKVNWENALQPLIKKYKKTKHPLEYRNLYELLVMVVLSAQSTDDLVNKISVDLFKKFPGFASLSKANIEQLIPYISKIRSFRKKGEWLISIAKQIKQEKNIPLTMKELTDLPGIGRKSANVIMREAGAKAEGVIVDLHVIRVAQRTGISKSDDAKKIEQDIMKAVPEKYWSDTGMALSFLGRDTCRPTDPKHSECVLNPVCSYYAKILKKKKKVVALS